VDIDVGVRDAVLSARNASTGAWNETIVVNLLGALTSLAVRLAPVSALSLRAYNDETRQTVRVYWIVAICLAVIIVPFSIASFVTSAISTALRTDIISANDLAVKLRDQLGAPSPSVLKRLQEAHSANKDVEPGAPSFYASSGPPPVVEATGKPGVKAPSSGVGSKPAPESMTKSESQVPKGVSGIDIITELQQFASTVRAIDAGTQHLNWFVFDAEKDPYKSIRTHLNALHNTFQLPAGLTDFSEAAAYETYLYQDIRFLAQNVLDDVSFYYGAITTCLLPVLYALLGTCAYLLRSFEEQMKAHTFTPSHANSARFLIAGIGGAVVGLFNNFTITQSASISPLAIAFLVGYAVDVFFSFLEGLIQSFTKSKSNVSPPILKPSSGGAA
jgi:hypothetical protein